MNIPLFLPDFKRFVKNHLYNSTMNTHPVFYSENELRIIFYKPIENVLYFTEVYKEGLPKEINIEDLKREFESIEIPSTINDSYILNLQGTMTQ